MQDWPEALDTERMRICHSLANSNLGLVGKGREGRGGIELVLSIN